MSYDNRIQKLSRENLIKIITLQEKDYNALHKLSTKMLKEWRRWFWIDILMVIFMFVVGMLLGLSIFR